MDKQPTEARQDELAGIREKIAQQLTILIYGDVATWEDLHSEGKLLMLDRADQILSLTVSSGGGVCPECKGKKRIYRHIRGGNQYEDEIIDCPTCNGTGRTKVVEKTLMEIIKEWKDEKRS